MSTLVYVVGGGEMGQTLAGLEARVTHGAPEPALHRAFTPVSKLLVATAFHRLCNRRLSSLVHNSKGYLT